MRILIVEDDLSMAGSLQRGLVAEGYVVDVANDGVAGLAAATDVDYDAIVCGRYGSRRGEGWKSDAGR